MNPIIDRYTFKTLMKNIRCTLELQNKIDMLCVDYGDRTGYNEPYITLPSMADDVIALLEIIFNDDGILFSWIYDTNFGKIRYEGLPEAICSIKDDDSMYDYLVATMNTIDYIHDN